jgi:aspartate aminotransferase
MVKEFEERNRYVQRRLAQMPGVTWPAPCGAFYIFPNFSAYYGKGVNGKVIRNSLDMAEYLMEKAHIAVVPGSAFGEDRCLRLSYALSSTELVEGFDRLAAALNKLS